MQAQALFVEPAGWLQPTRADLDWTNQYLSTSDVHHIPQHLKAVKSVLYADLYEECLRVLVLEDEEGRAHQYRPVAARHDPVYAKEADWRWVPGHRCPA